MSHTGRFLAGAADPAHLPKLGYPEFAFAGRSNVGKSSLLNRLVGHHALARVSKTPGRTQQINFFLIDERLIFADLPGYGFARVPAHVQQQWKHLVEAYLTQRRNLCGVAVLIDLRRGMQDDDIALLDYLAAHRIPAVVVATKADKLARGERVQRARTLTTDLASDVAATVVCAASDASSTERLWQEIRDRVDAFAPAGRER